MKRTAAINHITEMFLKHDIETLVNDNKELARKVVALAMFKREG